MHRGHAGARDDRGRPEVHADGDRNRVRLRDDGVLRVAAVPVEPELLRFGVADVGAPAQALFASAAEDLVVERHARARLHRYALAGFLHHAGRLVAEGHRVGGRLDHSVEDVQIGAAYAGRVDADLHLSWPRIGRIHIVESQDEILVDPGCTHVVAPYLSGGRGVLTRRAP